MNKLLKELEKIANEHLGEIRNSINEMNTNLHKELLKNKR